MLIIKFELIINVEYGTGYNFVLEMETTYSSRTLNVNYDCKRLDQILEGP